jgi:Viral BACON domain/Putative binding domain, N-terminal
MFKVSSRSLLMLVLPTGLLWACGRKDSPTQPTPPACTYTLSTSSLSFPASGGTNPITVTTASHCAWTAASDRGWMSIASGTNATGSGTVNVSLTPNATPAERTGTLAIAGHSVSVRQDDASCTIQISPTSASFGKDSATGTFAVTAAEHCQWSATSNTSWLHVTSGSPGTGNGTLAYGVDRNREVTSRTGAITVGERRFTVRQAADTPPAPVCQYSVTPLEFAPCMSAPFNMTATITTQPSCTWTAEPDTSWITVTGGQSGSGPGVITFRVSDNWDAPRQSVVKVRWPTATAGQNLQVHQAGCRYAVSTNLVNMPDSGGSARFDVIQESDPYTCGGPTQNACMWIAQSDVSWLTVTTTMPQYGDGPVSFIVSANDGTNPRTGRILVRDKLVEIMQAGR